MKHTLSVRHTIRFRRWSRKAYAAFASIGRCVTIGCLPKSIADSALSKQKSTGTVRRAGCEEDTAWKGITLSKETDIGIPLGSSTTLANGITRPTANLQILFGLQQVIRPCAYKGEEKAYILKQRYPISTDCQEPGSTFRKLPHLDNPCFFFIHEPNHRKI